MTDDTERLAAVKKVQAATVADLELRAKLGIATPQRPRQPQPAQPIILGSVTVPIIQTTKGDKYFK